MTKTELIEYITNLELDNVNVFQLNYTNEGIQYNIMVNAQNK